MTRRFRSIGAFGSLAAALLLGAAALTRAQPPQADETASPRKALRDRLIKLRAEVELLQLEHKADRKDLAEELKNLRRFERDGLSKEELGEVASVVGALRMGRFQTPLGLDNKAAELRQLGVRIPDANPPDEAVLAGLLKGLGMEIPKGKTLNDVNFVTLGQRLVEKESMERRMMLSARIAEKKERFLLQTHAFHERRLDLDDAERRYNQTH